jgi:hypothetical protein
MPKSADSFMILHHLVLIIPVSWLLALWFVPLTNKLAIDTLPISATQGLNAKSFISASFFSDAWSQPINFTQPFGFLPFRA